LRGVGAIPSEEALSMRLGWPDPGHESHLCYLQNMGMIEADLENYKELVRDGTFVCAKCGRVAREAKSLCSPVAL
jgi:hypothetical protein